MGQIHTGVVKGLRRAPYRAQVEVHMIDMGYFADGTLTAREIEKVERCARFLPAYDCAREITDARSKATSENAPCI